MAGDFGRHSLYKMLGYFSLVGLLRLHSLLGDYYQAVKALENIDIHKKVCSGFLREYRVLFVVPFILCFVLEPFCVGACLSDHNGILRWLRLHDDASLRRCHSNIQFGIVVFTESQAAVPVSYLSKRSGSSLFRIIETLFSKLSYRNIF